jgi:GTP pyrophosphokinase
VRKNEKNKLTRNNKSKSAEVEEGLRVFSPQERLKIEKALEDQGPRNGALLEEIVFILRSKFTKSRIKIHDIEQRIKKAESVIDKCERKGIQDHNLLVDVVGARVVCLFRSDMLHVAEVISSNFDVVGVDDKLSNGGPLGYQSTHYVCKLPSRYKGPRYENTAGVEFEIQVRTLCMHAWAAVSHHLEYKGDWDVPEDLKQALGALGGLFYVADNQFEQFYSARQKSKFAAETAGSPKESSQELNLDTIIPYLKKQFEDRDQPNLDSASKLIREMKSFGYESIRGLDKVINRGEAAFHEYEVRFPPSSGGRFAAVGVVRVTDRIVSRRSVGDAIDSRVSEVASLVKPE